ncbi:MAG: hypothetical protein R3Y63_13110 [Eubacteriales bacterium]
MPNRTMMCILHDHLVEEKHEVTGQEIRKKASDLVDAFMERLNEEEKKAFEEILNAGLHTECNSNEDHFVLGFRTGFQLAMEVTSYGNQ